MDILFYIIALLICITPFIYKEVYFLDILPLLILYFDATYVFISHPPTYNYFEYAIILIFALVQIIKRSHGKYFKNFNTVYYIIIALLLFPLLNGEALNPTLRLLSLKAASIILLPIAFYHYSQKGNVGRLIKSGYLFILLYVLYVLIATPFKLGGYSSERIVGTTFYFGYIANRGGITYISFMLLIIPLIVVLNRKLYRNILLFVAVGFIIIVFFIVLKRFVFIAIGLGTFNYLFRPILKVRHKVQISFVLSLLLIFIFTNDLVKETVQTRFEERGGESKFSEDAIEGDLRIYEPIYVINEVFRKPLKNILIGSKDPAIYDVVHDGYTYKDREIHNHYATLLSDIGIIGLLLYLSIFFLFYKYIYRFYKISKRVNPYIIHYWVVFQNLIVIFFIEGMVGGHTHIGFRGLVFLYAGALGGYIYHQANLTLSENSIIEKV